MSFLPTLLVHADWSVQPQKCWLARATLQTDADGSDGGYVAHLPEAVGDSKTLLARLLADAGPAGRLLLGFDFPIGLPAWYANRAGIDTFLSFLGQLGQGHWPDFTNVAERPPQISLRRPFYPVRPGGARQQHLLDGLGASSINLLRRRCDLPRPGRRAAAPLFWTLGGQQVGKAALNGWLTVLLPALQSPIIDLVIWPFDGPLFDLFRPHRVIIAETYPAECYDHLGVTFPHRPSRRSGKRVQASRAENGPALLAWAKGAGIVLTPELEAAITSGFGPDSQGEDRFDATIGLFGMLNVILGRRLPGTPNNSAIRTVEGWILGMAS